jgi:hypothetical protein
VRNGEFVGQFAPYGYMKDPADKHKLLIDHEVAWVVRKIFEMAAEGTAADAIARCLNEEGVPTRYQYHQICGDNYPDKQKHVKIKKWDGSSVKDIIIDEVYLGKLLWNRTKCGMDTGKKVVRQDRKDWIIVDDHHEPIVTQELFDKANARYRGKEKRVIRHSKANPLFICGHCGKAIQIKSRTDKLCCRSRKLSRENHCMDINIPKEELEEAVMASVQVMAKVILGKIERSKCREEVDERKRVTIKIKDNAAEIERWKSTKMQLYEEYRSGASSKADYLSKMEKGKLRLAELEADNIRLQERLKNIPEISEKQEAQKTVYEELAALKEFDKEKILVLIKKVIVYSNSEIEIIWRTNDFIEEGMIERLKIA